MIYKETYLLNIFFIESEIVFDTNLFAEIVTDLNTFSLFTQGIKEEKDLTGKKNFQIYFYSINKVGVLITLSGTTWFYCFHIGVDEVENKENDRSVRSPFNNSSLTVICLDFEFYFSSGHLLNSFPLSETK